MRNINAFGQMLILRIKGFWRQQHKPLEHWTILTMCLVLDHVYRHPICYFVKSTKALFSLPYLDIRPTPIDYEQQKIILILVQNVNVWHKTIYFIYVQKNTDNILKKNRIGNTFLYVANFDDCFCALSICNVGAGYSDWKRKQTEQLGNFQK